MDTHGQLENSPPVQPPPIRSSSQAVDSPELDRFLAKCLPGKFLGTVRESISLFCASEVLPSLLVTGRPGSGKTYLARIIAAAAKWSQLSDAEQESYLSFTDPVGPLSTGRVGCVEIPGIPDTLVESELFGYKKGAFTGAEQNKPGLVDTPCPVVLLDEIADASPFMQAKLLRLVQDHTFRPIGAKLDEVHAYEGKLIWATNKNLPTLVAEGKFREDLFQRLNTFHIEMPDLHADPEYIRFALEFMLEKLSHQAPAALRGGGHGRLSPEDEEWALRYGWPGNFRQLESVTRKWFAMGCPKGRFHECAGEPEHLADDFEHGRGVRFGEFRRILHARVDHFLYEEIRRLDDAAFESLFPGSRRTSALAITRRRVRRDSNPPSTH
ncbi:MAG: sigma-54-dependent Fis family transcriptional regulator [Nitrospirae bacterium]|nr:sigma-54-dependent Fis family transcriptional regulator [Nitrospirota bacterium]